MVANYHGPFSYLHISLFIAHTVSGTIIFLLASEPSGAD
jgi:hypothetical protein